MDKHELLYWVGNGSLVTVSLALAVLDRLTSGVCHNSNHGGITMSNDDETLDLRTGDLVLLQYQGKSPDGHVFEFVDKAGTMDDTAGPDNSDSANSQQEPAVATGFPTTDPRVDKDPESVIQILERQRTVLDQAIAELRGTSPGNPDSVIPGKTADTTMIQSSKDGSPAVQPRRFRASDRKDAGRR